MTPVIIVIGTAVVFVGAFRVSRRTASGHDPADVWIRYGRWPVAGLTFQLAADILETWRVSAAQMALKRSD